MRLREEWEREFGELFEDEGDEDSDDESDNESDNEFGKDYGDDEEADSENELICLMARNEARKKSKNSKVLSA